MMHNEQVHPRAGEGNVSSNGNGIIEDIPEQAGRPAN
jgi:hypothetical protein